MRMFSRAFDDKLLKTFTIRPNGWEAECDGILKRNDGTIEFVVSNGFENIYSHNLDTQTFDIVFSPNLSSFKVQHKAIAWMKEHSLFKQLIRNPQYESRSKCTIPVQNTFEFR